MLNIPVKEKCINSCEFYTLFALKWAAGRLRHWKRERRRVREGRKGMNEQDRH
jgi:hypothetical protein